MIALRSRSGMGLPSSPLPSSAMHEFFFFQAEDGIRDLTVTGVQTCALPICRAVAQIHGVYILAENAQGMVVVDMHAAHERIVYEQLKNAVNAAEQIPSQPLLIPATFAATPEEVATAEAHGDTLQALGMEVSPFSPKTLAVRAVPATLAQGDAVELARSVLAELAQHEIGRASCRERV